MEEASESVGWLRGPFTAEEVAQRQGPLWLPIRRFMLRQRATQQAAPVDELVPPKLPPEPRPGDKGMRRSSKPQLVSDKAGWLPPAPGPSGEAMHKVAGAPADAKPRIVDNGTEFL